VPVRIPFLDENDPDAAQSPLLGQGPVVPSMLPQDPGPAPALTRIGDETPLGRFAQPILPPAPPPQVETVAQGDRNLRRVRDQGELDKLNAPHMGQPGSSHPGWGGKILHGLAEAGNIAGNIVAPGTMSLIRGTDLNNNMRRSALNRDLNDVNQEDLKDLSSQASTAKTTADTTKTNAETAGLPQEQTDKHGLSEATTRHTNDEANLLEHPLPQYEIHDTQSGPLFVNKVTGAAQHLSVDGHPIGPKIQTKTVQLQIGGKPHQVLVNEADGTPIKDLGESGEKPPVTNINQGSWALEEDGSGKPVLFNSKTGLTKDAPNIQKPGTASKANAPYQALIDEAAQAHQLADLAEAGNAPADVDLALSFFKTMRGAGGAGIRFTQAEQNLIMGARSTAGDIEGAAQKVLGGGQKFTPEQRNNILKVIDLHAQAAQKHLAGSGGGGAATPGAGTQAFTDGGVTYHIPADQVAEFKKDHPHAR
jgi:hypothetical protein